MFGIGFGEVLLLAGIGIIVLGPARCVHASKTLGKMVKKLQHEWRSVQQDLSNTNE